MPAIVVGVDASADAVAALRWAAAEARSTTSSLVVVHAYWVPLAYPRDDFSVARIDPEFHARAQASLDDLLDTAGAALDGVHVVPKLQPGRAADALLAHAGAADLLVLGRRGVGGFEGLFLGAARADAVGVYEPHRAGMPFGGEFMQLASPDSERRLRQAADQAVTQALGRVRANGDVEVQRSIEAGNPAKVLIDRSREADLVVVGSRGLGGFSGLLLGSVGRQLLHHAACPVAVVRG